MQLLANTSAVVGIFVGLVGLFLFEGFCVACMPNGSDEVLRTIKRLMLFGGIAGLLLVGVATWLLIAGHPWWAAAFGVSPLVATILWLVIASIAS